MRNVIVVDLDGTLVNGNSFTLFCKYLLFHTSLLLPVSIIILTRKLRLISHHEAKQRIIRLAKKKVSEKMVSEFIARLKSRIRPVLAEELKRSMLNGDKVLLASAAPAYYVKVISEQNGFTDYLATEPGDVENKGKEKSQRVEKWVDGHDGKISRIYTDHYDDIPLMELGRRHNAVLILINPSYQTIKLTDHLHPEIYTATAL